MNYKQMTRSIKEQRRLLWEEAGRPRFRLVLAPNARYLDLYLMMSLASYPWREFHEEVLSNGWYEDPWK